MHKPPPTFIIISLINPTMNAIDLGKCSSKLTEAKKNKKINLYKYGVFVCVCVFIISHL